MFYSTSSYFVVSVLLLAQLSFAATPSVERVNVLDYGAVANDGKDDLEAFNRALKVIGQSDADRKVLFLPEGRYDLLPEHATVKTCYMSEFTEGNHDAVRHIALNIEQVDNLHIQGEGADIVTHGELTTMVMEHCKGVTISGVNFDLMHPSIVEMKCVEVGKDYWIGQVTTQTDWVIEDGKTLVWKYPDWQFKHNQFVPLDVEENICWYGRGENDPTRNVEAIVDLGDGRLRFEGGKVLGKQGYVYQFRDTYRDEIGLWFSRCDQVVIKEVSLYAAHMVGMLFQFCDTLTFSHLNVAPREGSGRTAAIAADILHFSGCKGQILVEHSTLSSAHDDAINVHGTYLRIVEQPQPDQLKLHFDHHQSWGFQAFQEGDQIELAGGNSLLSKGEVYEVKKVEMIDPRHQAITVDRPVEGVVLGEDLVENITWTPSLVVRHCTVERIPTRAILITTRQPCIIENNRFVRPNMAAIRVATDSSSWMSSGPVRDLTIRNNEFIRCDMYRRRPSWVIEVIPSVKDFQGPVHENIKITGNRFIIGSNRLLRAYFCSDIELSNNEIIVTHGAAPDQEAFVRSADASNIVIRNNPIKRSKNEENGY